MSIHDFNQDIHDWTSITAKPKPTQDWEQEFDKEFYEGLYCCAESDGEYYDEFENVKKFIRQVLERQK